MSHGSEVHRCRDVSVYLSYRTFWCLFCSLDIIACKDSQILTLISLVLFALHQSNCQLSLVHCVRCTPSNTPSREKVQVPYRWTKGHHFGGSFSTSRSSRRSVDACVKCRFRGFWRFGSGHWRWKFGRAKSKYGVLAMLIAKRRLGTELDPG